MRSRRESLERAMRGGDGLLGFRAMSVHAKKKALVAFVTFFALVPAAGATTLTRAERSLLQAMNATRAAHGAGPLRLDAALERAARAHSADMLHKGYFSHAGFPNRVWAAGVRSHYVGENLAWGSGSYAAAQQIVGEWMASPPHRANLLRRTFHRIGVGILVGRFEGFDGASVVTADFSA
jgi:uncharacterized protein YkwD